MADGIGNEAQVRVVAEQIADAAITRFASVHPGLLREPPARVEIPAPLKWAAGVAASIFTLASGAGLLWLVSTVNDIQITVAVMNERQVAASGDVDARYDDLARRITILEGHHARGEQ